jgi:predicted enzyme related to lactoylglutathione lyase
MLERTSYPPGVPCWVDTAQPDPEAAVTFYNGVFGWELTDRLPPEAPGSYFIGAVDGLDAAGIGPPTDGLPPEPVRLMYVAVESADATAEAVTAAGGTVTAGPTDIGPPGRLAICQDPAGATFALWEAGQRAGAAVVNEPGTWNFNELHTADPDQAKAFYGAVFGWEAVDLDFGDEHSTMWCRPGYGDFLQSIDPDLESRQARAAAPPGFADSVGWLYPLDDGESPHWSTTFAVDDTDAAVERVVAFGGEVVRAPETAGVVRVATVRDPQGAELNLSHFDPTRAG